MGYRTHFVLVYNKYNKHRFQYIGNGILGRLLFVHQVFWIFGPMVIFFCLLVFIYSVNQFRSNDPVSIQQLILWIAIRASTHENILRHHMRPEVHFIITKCRCFKRQNMVFKCRKWRLTFNKFHKTILVFKTPKCDVVIPNTGVLNAQKQGVWNAKKEAF